MIQHSASADRLPQVGINGFGRIGRIVFRNAYVHHRVYKSRKIGD
ncbi:MAG: hypothetical protein EON93_25710 [Burkholderiales bacterium]|nr:MAG: hypothetical protein EON93_25710 [Burkholderiales bacterium]